MKSLKLFAVLIPFLFLTDVFGLSSERADVPRQLVLRLKKAVFPIQQTCTAKNGPNISARTGTGFFVTRDGKFITAHHVMATDPACSFAIILGSGEISPEVIPVKSGCKRVGQLDLAVCELLENPFSKSGSKDRVSILSQHAENTDLEGMSVLAVGYPAVTSGWFISRGLISSFDIQKGLLFSDHDAWPGMSGGALIDDRGNVIGVILGRQGAFRTGTNDEPGPMASVPVAFARSHL